MGRCPYGYDAIQGGTAMTFTEGDKVALLDGRTGRIIHVNPDGTYAVYVEDDPVAEATRGHKVLRSDVDQPEAAPLPTDRVPADQLRGV